VFGILPGSGGEAAPAKGEGQWARPSCPDRHNATNCITRQQYPAPRTSEQSQTPTAAWLASTTSSDASESVAQRWPSTSGGPAHSQARGVSRRPFSHGCIRALPARVYW